MADAYSVALTARARVHFGAIHGWWGTNRPAAPELFAREFRAAARRIAFAPHGLAVYRRLNDREIRRVLLPRSRYHVYFEVNEGARHLFILAIWHVARGGRPAL